MTWNYRVTQERVDDDTYVFGIREVYYNDAGEIQTWTKDTMDPHGEDLEELQIDLNYMQAAMLQPVLELSEDRKRLYDPGALP